MTSMTFCLFAGVFTAVIAHGTSEMAVPVGNETNFFRRASIDWENSVFDASNTTRSQENFTGSNEITPQPSIVVGEHVVPVKMPVVTMTPVVPDRVFLGSLDYNAMDGNLSVTFKFLNARLEGLSHFKIEKFTRSNATGTVIDNPFNINYAEVKFRAGFVGSRFHIGTPTQATEECFGQLTIILKNVAVGGNFRIKVDDDGLDMKLSAAINLNKTSSAGFVPRITGCIFGGYLVRFVKKQSGSPTAEDFKQILIQKVEAEIFKPLNL